MSALFKGSTHSHFYNLSKGYITKKCKITHDYLFRTHLNYFTLSLMG